ncbi:hypothetical protein EI42_05445 [Thermosporothrix hazakensis]|jgi:hypothetical protein|uniref:CAAX prenyl protease-like protein n=1 Tax=Thermosporothrix hazakensis TaxID=644383 RepID=A0A326TZ55_THEHA|nr:hypothetical protein [Thermosporothrix hazakensis]PZW22539.1 hypothetical protein EI42_05445 [Thermosporothrix hazakensis]GCE50225.1 hypothetical protein KTH_50940 [Thermosporothrix hazakensis]
MFPGNQRPPLLLLPYRNVEVVYDRFGQPHEVTKSWTIPCGCSSLLIAIPLILLVKWLWPNVIPFDLFAFWTTHGDLTALPGDIWPFIVGGLVVTLYELLFRMTEEERLNFFFHWAYEGGFFHKSFIFYTIYGFLEEVCFRWVLFYSYIVGLTVANVLFFGFAGFGLFQWLFLHVFGPAADFVTLHKLHDILFGSSWVIGAAILSANGKFRQGHAYQGWIGWLWAWFGGMFLFLVMFHYGLPIAIGVHILYNLLLNWGIYFLTWIDYGGI